MITFLVPGLRFFHEGQLEGRKVHVSMHLGRRPDEPPDPDLRAFYDRLLAVLAPARGPRGELAALPSAAPAWADNPTWDRFVVMAWEGARRERLLAVVNYGPTQAQCWAEVPFARLSGKVVLRDLLGDARYDRDGGELASKGLYLDLPPWGRNVFALDAG